METDSAVIEQQSAESTTGIKRAKVWMVTSLPFLWIFHVDLAPYHGMLIIVWLQTEDDKSNDADEVDLFPDVDDEEEVWV